MKYIILRRNTGDLDLEAAESLQLSTMYYDMAEYKNFPREPREPKRIPAPDYAALGGTREWEANEGRGGWVWHFPDEESRAKAEALAAEYKPKAEANYAAYQAWQQRKRAWDQRRQKAGLKAMRNLDPKEQRYSFAGGSSRGVSLAPRLRFLRLPDQRKFDELDREIQRLQERRRALIEAAFRRGIKPTPKQVLDLALEQKRDRERAYKRASASRPYFSGFHGLKNSLDSKWRFTPKPQPVEKKEAA